MDVLAALTVNSVTYLVRSVKFIGTFQTAPLIESEKYSWLYQYWHKGDTIVLLNDFVLISAIFMIMLMEPLVFILIEKRFLEGLHVDPKIHQQIVFVCL